MKTHHTSPGPLFVLICLTFLWACDGGTNPPQHRGPSPVLLEDQAELFQATCANCHQAEDSDAPQVGDTQDWDKRWSKGFDTLFTNTVNGVEGMPALGTCAACSQQELEIFIQYLGGRSLISDKEAE